VSRIIYNEIFISYHTCKILIFVIAKIFVVISLVDCGGSGDTRNMTGRRTKLPCPKPDTEGLSLWNLLCKNIGKDLSQVSMPVALNEPLNMLQVNTKM